MLVYNVLIFALTALSAGALPGTCFHVTSAVKCSQQTLAAPVKNNIFLESAADAELAGRSRTTGNPHRAGSADGG
jgi:hypothetical protein